MPGFRTTTSRRMRPLAAVGLVFLLGGCVNIATEYKPESPRRSYEVRDWLRPGEFITFDHPGAETHLLAGGTWSTAAGGGVWMERRAVLRFNLRRLGNRKLALQMTAPPELAGEGKRLGLTILVNNRRLETVVWDTPGPKSFEKPVPEEWLRLEPENLVTLEADRTFSSLESASERSVLIHAAGFR